MLAPMLFAMAALNGPERGSADAPAAATRYVAPGPQYRAGALHRFLFGSGYRALWSTPIAVEVLDLDRFAGGLDVRKKGGGKETKTLSFEDRDGRKWRFRSIEKDATLALPAAVRGTYVNTIAQDQISACLPANVLAVDRLAAAVGLPYVEHRLVVLPDSPRLGEFRQEFAGMLGTLEETVSVTPPVTRGFEEFSRMVGTEELYGVLDADPRERVDARAFLKARLFDMFIGDYDRHEGQWEWLKNERAGLWQPFPKDRDLAFVKFGGIVLDLARTRHPRLVNFEESYSKILGLTWQARFLDRRYLAELEWPAWKEGVAELQGLLTDAAIDEAMERLPPAHYRVDGPALAATLKVRRQRLPELARRFYELLAREPEVHGTDRAEALRIERDAKGAVDVTLEGEGRTLFRRRFDPSETREVRVFLKGGDDRVTSTGHGGARIRVRVVGGGGDDLLDDSAGGHTRFYDSEGHDRIVRGPGTRTSARAYTAPLDSEGDPARDWGGGTSVGPRVRFGEDYGAVLGLMLQRTQYGFRTHPYAARHSLRAEYATALASVAVHYDYRSLGTDDRTRVLVAARASALDLTRFYGFGNETSSLQPPEFYEVRQTQYALAPAYRVRVPAVDVLIGPVLKYADTRLPASTLIGQQQPYGTNEGFGQVGGRLGLTFDRRDREAVPSRGFVVSGEGSFYPGVWSVTESFGEIHGVTAAYLRMPIPLASVLALRAGGLTTWGRYPLQEAATIGGSESVRGLSRQRYTGDASLYGNAELRLRLAESGRVLPFDLGVLGLADTGRVFLRDAASTRWHTGVGGGLWLSFADAKSTFSLVFAQSEGDGQVYLQAGFGF